MPWQRWTPAFPKPTLELRMVISFLVDGRREERLRSCLPCQGCREEHLVLGFEVVGIFDGSGEIFDCASESLEGEDVGDGVCSLVSWAVDGVGWTRLAFVVGDGGPGFEAVAEDVES
jgi:hypothetical protein